MMKRLILLLFLLPCLALAQGEANWWFFGHNAGLNFNSGSPVPNADGQLFTFEGCSAISDACGNLEFYSDGTTVWDRNHNVMPNGTGLDGNPSAAQSAIVIPDLGNPDVYFIFTVTGGNTGVRYSIVDMNLNGGNGDVIPNRKNIQVTSGTHEKIAAVLDQSGNNYWIGTFKSGSTYETFQAGGGAVNPNAVVSNTTASGALTDNRGCMKFSPNGSKVANASVGDGSVIADFDNVTGVVSNERALNSSVTSPQGSMDSVYGVEFSPNSQILYTDVNSSSGGNGNSLNNNKGVLQYDTTQPGFENNPFVLWETYGDGAIRGALQTGPDGNIYVARSNTQWLGVIPDPNIPGAGAGFVRDAVQLSPGTFCREGLPPFIASFFTLEWQARENVGTDPTVNPPETEFCVNEEIFFDVQADYRCPTILIEWDFGDGSPINNTQEPVHTYSAPGTYTVTLNVGAGLTGQTFTRDITVYEIPVIENTPAPLTECDTPPIDGTATFDLTQNDALVLGSQTGPFTIEYYASQQDAENRTNALTSPYDTADTTIWVSIFNSNLGRCSNIDSFTVSVAAPPAANPADDIVLCDDVSNDGVEAFDLTSRDAQVLGGQSTAQYDVTYFENQTDADNNQNPINPADSYIAADGQLIVARVSVVANDNCFQTTSFNLVLNEQPVASNPQDLRVCDTANDNSENIDLARFDDEIDPTMNANFAITYHPTQADADNNTNAISANQTITGNEQFFARIENVNNIECFDTTSFNVFLDAQAVANTIEPYRICDAGNDGTEDFDFSTTDPQILDTQNPSDFNIEYFTSQADADLGSVNGAIPLTSPYPSGGEQVFVRIENVNNPDCFETTDFELFVDAQPVASPAQDLRICDTGNDNSEDVDLSQFDADIDPSGNPDFDITYHSSQADADNNTNALSSPYNISSTQQIFARVENINNEDCFDTTSFNVFLDTQPVANAVADYIQCDSGNDGAESFDFGLTDPEVLDGQNPADFNIEYFLSQSEADQGSVNGASPLPNVYISGGEQIFVRIENVNNTDCFDTISFNLVVDELPVAAAPQDLRICDVGGDGSEDVDLSQFDADAQGGAVNPDFTVTYYSSQADADAGNNALGSPYTVNGSPTLFVRVENDNNQSCFDTSSFTISVDTQPVANDVANLRVCDDQNDGSETVGLNQFNSELLGNQNPADFNIEYFLTQADADNGSVNGATPLPVSYTTSGEIIFARIENANNTECFDTTSFELFVDPSATAGTVDDIVVCDDASNDGEEDVDLSQFDSDVLNGQDPSVFSISYYDNQNDANSGNNELTSPYTVNANSPTIYARVDNAENPSCFAVTSFEFTISRNPVVNDYSDLIQCDDATNDGTEVFVLDEVGQTILGDQSSVTVVTLTGTAGTAIITLNGTDYLVTFDTDLATTASNFVSTYSAALAADDFIVNAIDESLSFADQNATALPSVTISNVSDDLNGTVDQEFNVTYYLTANDAVDGVNAISSDYNSSTDTPDTLFFRIENTANPECFETGSFTVTVSEQPIAGTAMDIEECDDRTNDGSEEFDLSLQNIDVLAGLPDTEFGVSYHSSEEDAMNGQNALPNLYTNTSSPQTIYARVENLSNPDCYDISTFDIFIYPRPQIAPQQETIFCAGDNAVLDAGPGFVTYDWSTGETTQSIEVNTEGDYSVTVSNDFGCTTTLTISVRESDAAVIDDIVVEQYQSNNNRITVVVSGPGDYEYSLDGFVWQDSPRFDGLLPGRYVVYVNDKNGCGVTQFKTMIIGAPPFFTPNSDGFNDTWQVTLIETEPDAKLYIFDRYGKLLKQIGATGEGWDGTFNGQPMPSSDYWYKVELSDGTTFSGHFALKR